MMQGTLLWRHTYASMMLSAGEQPTWVSQQMGHSNLAMIFQNYGRWIPDAQPWSATRQSRCSADRP